MPNLFEDGGVGPGSTTTTTSAVSATLATAYTAASAVAANDRTAEQQQIVDDVDAALAAVTSTWTDYQQAVAADITAFITGMQSDLQRTIRKNVRRGWSEQALTEMFAAVTVRVGQIVRLLFEVQQIAGSGPAGGYQTVQDEGSSLTARTIMSFEGAGVSAADSGSKTVITIPGATTPEKVLQVKVIDDATTLTTGDGKVIFAVSDDLNGLNLVDADAFLTTVSSSGTPTVQVRNVTQAADMLSTRITIDASEYTSYTAAAAPVIDTANDDVATGDLIAIDVDVAGTGAKGLGVILTFS